MTRRKLPTRDYEAEERDEREKFSRKFQADGQNYICNDCGAMIACGWTTQHMERCAND